MWKFRILLFTFFIFCIVLAFLGIYYFQKTQSEKIIRKNKLTAQELKQQNTITSMSQLGTKWDDYHKIGEGPFTGLDIIKFVSDGNIIRDPIELKTKEGEVLAISIVAFRGYYYDALSQKQSILIPMLLRLTDGRMYHPAYNYVINWNEEDIIDEINNEPQLFGAKKGMVMQVGSYSHVFLHNQSNSNQNFREYIFTLLDKYNKSWQSEIDKFYMNGDPTIGIVFTQNYFYPAKQDNVSY